jgi:catechol 2,3-dioxygenase-like lactoylglutathione lyase family enzyme
MRVSSLDHLVLTVADIERTASFYERVLGMERVSYDAGRHALRFGSQKLNLHQLGHELTPRAAHAVAGSADVCFLLEGSLEEAIAHLRAEHVTIEHGPVVRPGARGPIRSVYFRDPDNNLIEVCEPLPD